MKTKVIELNKNWRFKKASPEEQGEYTKTEMVSLPEDEIWYEARVPGCVHLDLLANKMIPDPFFEENEYKVQWVEECDWFYKCQFALPNEFITGAANRAQLELQLDGVDNYASVFLNEKKIATLNNMFIPWRLDVTKGIKSGDNELFIYFSSPKNTAKGLEKKHGVLFGAFETSRVYTRRAQYFTGWDWGPRLSGVGLWQPVRIVMWDTSRIDGATLFTREITKDKKQSFLQVDIDLYSSKDAEVSLVGEILFQGEIKARIEKSLSITKGKFHLSEELCLENPHLWYPNGFGDHPLYDLQLTLTKEEEILDQKNMRFGVRTVRLNQEKDKQGRKFIIEINGEPIFLKGMNWIPADSFPARIKEKDYREWIELAANSHVNCLRIWGGGIYEQEPFYRFCDEKGIMIWQDFMFACGAYPEEEWFLDLVKKEAKAQIKRLFNHPSIILWCGNNENEWMLSGFPKGEKSSAPGDTIFKNILSEICEKMDPSRPYWTSSPHGGIDPNSPDEGDRHNWEVWSNWKRFEEYAKDNGRFQSEFGFQAVPRNRTIFNLTKERDHNLNTPALQSHQKMSEGNSRLFRYLWAYLLLPNSFDELSYYSQLLQGEALKLGVQHWRSRKFETAGSLIWQLNDCWPVISWSLIDYYKRPKAAYYYARRFFSPLLSVLLFDPLNDFNFNRPERIEGKVRCMLVNDLPATQEGELILNVFNLKGEKIFEKVYNISVPKNKVLKIGSFSLSDLWITQPEREFVTLQFIQEDTIITRDTLLFRPWKYISFPKVDWRHIRINTFSKKKFEIVLKSDTFVKCVKIFLDQSKWEAAAKEEGEKNPTPIIPEYQLDDNFFDLIPQLEQRVICTFERNIPEHLFKSALTFQTLNDSFTA